jgi:lactoylglutathione lyase
VATGSEPADNVAMAPRARLIGFNHVALEVGDIEAALEFYGRLFEIKLRGRGPGMAFVDAGDQFIALSEGRKERPDDQIRHIGMVVDDKRAVRRALKEMGTEILPGRGGRSLDFLDPWGNRWQVVEYSEIQFTKAPHILRGMGLGHLRKTENALEELRRKGLAPD